MRRPVGLPGFAWALAALLLGSIGLMAAGRESSRTFPSLTSTKPSGWSVLGALLREQGVRVVQSTEPSPRLAPDDVAVAAGVGVEVWDSSSWAEQVRDDRNWTHIVEHVESGGRAVVVELPANFDAASLGAPTQGVALRAMGSPSTVKRVSAPSGKPATSYYGEERHDSPVLWRTESGPDGSVAVVRFEPLAKGTLVVVRSGLGTTNRFIDRLDNAEVFVSLLGALPGRTARLVFTEATFGNWAERSLTAKLGDHAVAARWQALLLAAVVAFALSRRFGLPEVATRRQRGVRELLDAMGDTMLRARRTDLALQLLHDDLDHRARRLLGLSPDASVKERDVRLPDDLVRALAEAAAAAKGRVPPREAHRIAKRLQEAYAGFESSAKASGSRGR